jgi:aquaporin Z
VAPALGVGAYIALAGLWGSAISGAPMNPRRTFGPDLIGANFTAYWVYVVGPLTGAVIAVAVAFVLRGYGGGRSGSTAAQGDLSTQIQRPDQRSAKPGRAEVARRGSIVSSGLRRPLSRSRPTARPRRR